MAETSVKICGLQDVEVLKSMINLPVDYIGFVFAKSKRQISADQAAGLIPILKQWDRPLKPESVGVFVNPTIEELSDILQKASLDIIQLHGQESPEFCREVKRRFGVKVFKVLSVKQDGLIEGFGLHEYQGTLDGMLLDTYDPIYGGGSGQTFDWKQIEPYREWPKQEGIPLIIAGGLHPDNVGDLLENFQPDGVDVSSGVETEGLKDIAKIRAFVERVKR
ncbi:phosphoribosylanthranilate isomerase [Paenibacillus zeisoli]|uniref:N-(5'-phosphoribosyl)anthranilate isomerase n=1 Tax=Paenibacillus zeisoli TaxID=2496267 RepID=A0A433XPV7_9BACL|nr:phosphoribosylanthranilate isomerase [Paenibacillus zeisoli]RUT36076.1 phosphoribosylanthranilate isomerase [Paenibacillus zeisoli]